MGLTIAAVATAVLLPSPAQAFTVNTKTTRVVYTQRYFTHEARRLAKDLGLHTAHHARNGDIVIRRAKTGAPESYALNATNDRLAIVARTRAGVFYGGRTLLAGKPINQGITRAAPLYPVRGAMLDDGRAFFSRAWLERFIKRLAADRLGTLQLHFSDDQGFRIESDTHPEIVTQPALTKADVRRLIQVAAAYHVTLVPEIDMPGHMTAALKQHPDLQLTDVTGQKQPDKLDVTNPAARKFAGELVDEFMQLFPAKVWHTGADEYLGAFSTEADYARYPQLAAYAQKKYGPTANGKDAVLDFTNEIAARVHRAGRSLRVWSDGTSGGSAVKLDPTASVMWWEEMHSPTPQELVDQGHAVINVGWWPLYYVTGGPLQSLRTPEEQMRDDWLPNEFSGPYSNKWAEPMTHPTTRLDPQDKRQLGAMLAIWNDDPSAPGATEPGVEQGTAPRLQILGAKTWSP